MTRWRAPAKGEKSGNAKEKAALVGASVESVEERRERLLGRSARDTRNARSAREHQNASFLCLYNKNDFLLVDRLLSLWLLIVIYLYLIIQSFYHYSYTNIISDSCSSYALIQTRPTESVYGYKDLTR